MSSRTLLSICTAMVLGAAAGGPLHAAEFELGKYVRVSPELELYYEEAGTGKPLIFVTGWTGTSQFFVPYQTAHFSQKYHVLAFDPRSQGRSTKTLEGNTYLQHGKDLRAFMEALKLKDVNLVGWSAGCHDVYSYFRTYGTDNISSFACIDETPREIAAAKGDWADYDYGETKDLIEWFNALIGGRREVVSGFAASMMQRKMTPSEVGWVVDQVSMTPDYVAVVLQADITFADYTDEARKIDGKIPVLNFVSEHNGNAAKAWLAKNAPHSETFLLGNHMMFREYPDKFNGRLETFLAQVKSP
jgi:non-heme chloroperoxidase